MLKAVIGLIVSAIFADGMAQGATRSAEGAERAGEFQTTAQLAQRPNAHNSVGANQAAVSDKNATIEQTTMRRDALIEAQKIRDQVEAAHPADADQQFAALSERQEAFYFEGRDDEVGSSLEVAIEIARMMVSVAKDSRQRSWAQFILGKALDEIGARENDATRLKQAVDAHRASLKDQKRDSAPYSWALTQNYLGNALAHLGEYENDTAQLEQAINAYREALKDLRQKPSDWAMVQNNLGNALSSLGSREKGTRRLEEAVRAYREALKERTRERAPLDWASANSNLGNTLAILGKRESGTARLEEAVNAYREALKEQTRERKPLDWASSIGGQGIALGLLAERRKDLAMAEQGLAQIETALATMTENGYAIRAAYYSGELPSARAIRDRLRPR